MSKSGSTYYIAMNCKQTLLAPVCIVHKCVVVLYFPTNKIFFDHIPPKKLQIHALKSGKSMHHTHTCHKEA